MLLEKRAQIPVETRSYGRYYLLFSAILFLGTMWSVWDEVRVRRPWKEYQIGYHDLVAGKLDSLRSEALTQIDSAQVAQLREALTVAQKGLESEKYVRAVEAKFDLQKQLDLETRDWRFARSRSDASYYIYKKSIHEGKEDTNLKEELAEHDASIVRHADEMEVLNRKIAEVSLVINSYKDPVDSLQIEHNRIHATLNSIKIKIDRARRQPIQIKQVVLNDFEFTPFNEVKARVDRCQTCHAGWADELMIDAPQPYTKHPVPELLAKHNPESFGCTPCHRGQGPALTSGFAHGDEDHYWETPLLRGSDVYATCNACHGHETVVKYGKPFTRAKQIVLESGCFGCHEIKGFADITRIGPPLNSLTKKTSPEWIFRWGKNPKDYNLHTRMPNFRFTENEAEAITSYLFNIGKSSPFEVARPRGSFVGGNVAAGKKLFDAVGCQACHTIGDDQTARISRGTSYDIAPELTRVGSKVSPDWLYDWLKNPRHYNPETRMPSLRLTDGEARDIVAYLATQKDVRSLPPVDLDLDNSEKIMRGDKLIREYGCAGCHTIKGMEGEGKVSVSLSDFGRKKVEQMDFGDTRELPHDAERDYVESPDGGPVAVKQTWRGWVWGKLKNSRLYQTERIVQKMPVFGFSDEEIGLVRMFMMGLTRDLPLAGFQHPFDRREQDIEAGRKLTMHYNCIQCHTLEDRGGYVLAHYEEAALGPPPLPESQGAKVQEPWLHGFLQGPSTIRPWLQIRMPTFNLSDDEISKVSKYFLGMSKQDMSFRDYPASPIEEKYIGPGKKLFDLYQCAKCHPTGAVKVGGATSASDLAPDLSLAASRLKPEWIVDWLDDPQKLQPGTRMPSFFFEGQAPDQTIFNGNARQQIKALKTYVWSLGAKRRSGIALGN